MKTRFFTLFLALIASVGSILAQNGTCGASLTWNLTNGVLTVSGTGDMYDYSLSSPQWTPYESSINTVVIDEGVTRIGACAFNYYTSLQNVTISNTVTSIGKGSFANTSISSIDIPNSVKEIGNASFQSCEYLTSVTIGNSVTSISNYAFSGCNAIRSFTCKAVYPPVCYSFCFNGVNKSIPLYVPKESVDSYSKAEEWKEFYNIQAINAEAIDEIIANEETTAKQIHNYQILIYRGGKTYAITGAEFK